eukprot:5076336-Prymnesium_polylepis.1
MHVHPQLRGSERHRCPQDGGAPHALVGTSGCGSCVQSIGHTHHAACALRVSAPSARCEECEP